ncbi:MAG: response regulator [Paracoccus sp. (in: a-proteobacteria)]|uniref:response regulator n=1 Tax=Paracoccus sp. TaxID=267 RepID=UPI0026DEBD8E|nr:response regulator [Paracoccus sp. (in: a-proteobacteria)]MDO5620430.1 response regulator [Paracoccus sp. (in: a-proteobacteria)]
MDGTVLIADDDRTIRTVLTQALTRAGCRVHATGSLGQLQRWVEEGRGDVVVTDVMMPDGNGIDMIPAIRRARPDLPVIVISAQNTIVTTIRATEADAFDYLPKPFDLPDLMARVRAGLERRAKSRPEPVPDMPALPAQDAGKLPLIGHAPVMQALFRSVARVLNADLPVLVTGEAGAGRSLVARSLHELSDRRDRQLGVLTAHDASAETLNRLARDLPGGTLIVEDAAGLDAAAQARLVGLLEDWEASAARGGPVAPRIIATAGPDPQEDLASGRLRADLYYRLAGVTLTVPPLRRRVEDIPALAQHLLTRAAAQGLPERSLSDQAEAVIRAHPFPGNVRELENLLRRLAVTAQGAEISGDEARAALNDGPMPAVSRNVSPVEGADGGLAQAVEAHLRRYFALLDGQLPPAGLYDRVIAEVERPLLDIALDATSGNQLRCAEMLGINRNTLRKKLTDLNIEVTRRRKLM